MEEYNISEIDHIKVYGSHPRICDCCCKHNNHPFAIHMVKNIKCISDLIENIKHTMW